MIAAVAENRVIGKDNDLIWHYPDDMAFFTKTTKGHFVIMGRKNYDSIPPKYCPLPGRTNVIVTRRENFEAPDCLVVGSLEEGIEKARENGDDEVFIIGGGQIYTLALERKLVDRMYITQIHKSFDGDTFYPDFDPNNWNKSVLEHHPADDRHESSFDICIYDKKQG